MGHLMDQSSTRRDANRRRKARSAAYREVALVRAVEALLNTEVTGVEYPGGKSRESYRLLLTDQRSVIATRRDTLERARREVLTLAALNRQATEVPRLIATNYSQILVQEEVAGTRLSQALSDADAMQFTRLLDAALESLRHIQRAATTEGLEDVVDALGADDEWLARLVQRPRVVGEHLDVPAPPLDEAALLTLLAIREPRFVKWDTRPGNALVTSDDRVVWFDWEHTGKRNRLDDVAWLLGDEFLPDFAGAETALIERHAHLFAEDLSAGEAKTYLLAYGSFHIVVRLGLILKHMDGKWWDQDNCIATDRVGVTLICATRLCRRGARWAAAHPLTAPLAAWFGRVEERVAQL